MFDIAGRFKRIADNNGLVLIVYNPKLNGHLRTESDIYESAAPFLARTSRTFWRDRQVQIVMLGESLDQILASFSTRTTGGNGDTAQFPHQYSHRPEKPEFLHQEIRLIAQ